MVNVTTFSFDTKIKLFVIVAIAFIYVVVVQHPDDLVFRHINVDTCG